MADSKRFTSLREAVRIITPAFVAGADQHASKEELETDGVRIPSIIHGMRWWFRALAGGIWGSRELTEIRNAESLLFGSAQPSHVYADGKPKDVGSVASRLRFTIRDAQYRARFVANANELPFSIRYLGYGMYPQKRGDPGRAYLEPGSKFAVEVEYYPVRGAGEPPIERSVIESLLRVWIRFGGLGGRWRHGLGGMALDQAVAGGDPCDSLGRQLIEARREVGKFLQSIRPGARGTLETGLPLFAVVNPDYLRLAAAPRTYTWEAALDTIHKLWRNNRLEDPRSPRSGSRNRVLYSMVANGRPPSKAYAQFAGLGLPIPFGFPQWPGRPTGVVNPGGDLERRASPIWFRLHPAAGPAGADRHHIFAVLWQSVYLPGEANRAAEIKITGESGGVEADFDPAESSKWFEGVLLRQERWREV